MRCTTGFLALALTLTAPVSLSAQDAPWAMWKSDVWKSEHREELSEDERLAGLALVWSEVKYNFANFDITKKYRPGFDWDAEFVAAVPRVRAAKNTLEYYRVMQELVAKLHDGHTYVWPSGTVASRLYASVPLRTRLVEGKVLVIASYDPASGVAVGEELIAIDGLPVHEYAAKHVAPFVFASTPHDRDHRVYDQRLLEGAEGTELRLAFRDANGRLHEERFTRRYVAHAPAKPLVTFEVLEGNVGYLVVNSFNDERLRARYDELWPRIAGTSALIIDIRENGGGNTNNGFHILKTLTNQPFLASRWRTRKYLPAARAWNRAEQWDQHEAGRITPDGTRWYAKPVVVLISTRTWSAAEDFSVAFDTMERGVFAGSATGGSTGQPLLVALPGGGVIGICSKRDQYADGREFVGAGVQPDVAVTETVAAIRAGRDLVLERALAEIAEQK